MVLHLYWPEQVIITGHPKLQASPFILQTDVPQELKQFDNGCQNLVMVVTAVMAQMDTDAE